MKNDTYIVTFATGKQETVYAFNPAEATILAQAKQIQAGNDYAVVSVVVKEEDSGKWANY